MQINFTCIGVGGSIANNYLRFTYAEASTPDAIEDNVVRPPVHSFPLAISQSVENPVPYIVKIYTTPDPGQQGTLLSEFTYDPTWTNVVIRLAIQLTVDGSGPYDPPEGSTTVLVDGSDPSEESISEFTWWPEMRSQGGRLRDDEYAINGNNDGFEYPYGFTKPDTIWICFAPKITVGQPTFNFLKLYNGIHEIVADEVMTTDHFNVLNEIVSNNNAVTVTMLPLASVPLNTMVTYSTNRGAQKQVRFVCAGTDVFEVYGGIPSVFLGEKETLQILRGPTSWHVIGELSGMAKVGIRVGADTGLAQAALNPNFRACDGSALPKNVYFRVGWYLNLLPGGSVVDIATRNADTKLRGRWAQDTNNWYLPDEMGAHRRNLPKDTGRDSGRDENSFTGDTDGSYLKDHTHYTVVVNKVTSGGFPAIPDQDRSMAREFDKTDGSGSQEYYLVGLDEEPTISPSSSSNDRRPGQITPQNENTVYSVGQVGGVFI